MLATFLSATLIGLDGRRIRVETDVAPGLPGFTIVGLADAALREARERVRGAIRNAGYAHPARRITVNLAPADLPKGGASLDLAIAVGVLVGSEQIRIVDESVGLLGELSLGGEVRPVPGTLPMVAALAQAGVLRVLVAAAAAREAALVEGVEIVAVASLEAAVAALAAGDHRRRRPPPRAVSAPLLADGAGSATGSAGRLARVARLDTPDLAEVRGQLEARRALEVALAGGHGLLLIGPPGTGKTLLARTIPGLLPPLDDDEAMAATIVASVAAGRPVDGLIRQAPFRAPHHTASYAAIVGGGPGLAPGEVTRADHGVLFLDELPEFGRDVLEALRQPLEDGLVTIARAGRSATLPARFQLVAAMNPCPCGGAGSDLPCACPPGAPERYVSRISGPLRDRIDIWVGLPRLPAARLIGGMDLEGSAEVASRVDRARARQLARPGRRLNARTGGRSLRAIAALSDGAARRLIELAEGELLSGRGTDRLLRVARTVADLAGAERVEAVHLEEAARWRAPASRPLAALAG